MTIKVLPPKTTSNPTPLQQVADRHRNRFAVAVGAAIDRVRASLTLAEIERQLVETGTVEPDWSRFWGLAKADRPVYEAVYLEAMTAGAKKEAEVRFATALTLINERAVQAARLNAAELVVGLSRDSRTAVQAAVGLATRGDTTVAGAARTIRDVIGLDPRLAVATVNYRASLEGVKSGALPASDALRELADQRFSTANLTTAKIETLVGRYSERALAERASTIARTESIRAAHAGQRALWDEAADQGLFDPNDASVVWVVTEDDRTCEECGPLDGETVGFVGGTFTSATREEHTAEYPPLHPRCRCTTNLDI